MPLEWWSCDLWFSSVFIMTLSGHTEYSWIIGNNQMVGVCVWGGGGGEGIPHTDLPPPLLMEQLLTVIGKT